MKSRMYSKKTYFVLAIIISFFWIINSFIPTNSCHQERYYGGVFHLGVCDNMAPIVNTLFIIFQVITLLGTAYLIVFALLFIKNPN